VKELNGRAVNVSPSGAAARESAFLQSYRAELTHFLAILNGDAKYDPPVDQLQVMDVLDAVYRSAEEGREIAL
jgi:predicted dehydrogenase